MSAREKIIGMFPASSEVGAAVADEILAEHARELIHRVRRAIADGDGNGWNWWDAATIPESVLALIAPDV